MIMLLELNRNETAHGDAREGKWRGKMRMEWVASSLASFIGTWSIQHYYWTDPPADLNGLVRFAERPILVSARVPSRSDSAIPAYLSLLRQQLPSNLGFSCTVVRLFIPCLILCFVLKSFLWCTPSKHMAGWLSSHPVRNSNKSEHKRRLTRVKLSIK
jgi:hypothetical protein